MQKQLNVFLKLVSPPSIPMSIPQAMQTLVSLTAKWQKNLSIEDWNAPGSTHQETCAEEAAQRHVANATAYITKCTRNRIPKTVMIDKADDTVSLLYQITVCVAPRNESISK